MPGSSNIHLIGGLERESKHNPKKPDNLIFYKICPIFVKAIKLYNGSFQSIRERRSHHPYVVSQVHAVLALVRFKSNGSNLRLARIFRGQMFVCVCSVVSDLCDPMDCSRQAPLTMEFPRQEYWSGLPLPSPGDLRGPRIKPVSLCHLYWQGVTLPLGGLTL